jgi:hypothetical protein
MSIESLVRHFSVVEDPRCQGKIEHRLIDILVIAVCAVIACAESWDDIALYGRSKLAWLRTFLELPNGIPSHDTFRHCEGIITGWSPGAERGLLWTRRKPSASLGPSSSRQKTEPQQCQSGRWPTPSARAEPKRYAEQWCWITLGKASVGRLCFRPRLLRVTANDGVEVGVLALDLGEEGFNHLNS